MPFKNQEGGLEVSLQCAFTSNLWCCRRYIEVQTYCRLGRSHRYDARNMVIWAYILCNLILDNCVSQHVTAPPCGTFNSETRINWPQTFCHSLDLPGIKFTLISSSKSFNWNTIDYKGNLKLSQGYSSLFIRDMFHVQDDLIR